MRAALLRDFTVPVRWEEPAARNTGDNLRLAAAMLDKTGIGAAYLVTHALAHAAGAARRRAPACRCCRRQCRGRAARTAG
jgi:hypothetical protein